MMFAPTTGSFQGCNQLRSGQHIEKTVPEIRNAYVSPKLIGSVWWIQPNSMRSGILTSFCVLWPILSASAIMMASEMVFWYFATKLTS